MRNVKTMPFAIVGVEAKIGANESEAQIADYQHALLNDLPSARKLLIFLTPSGYSSKTADEQSECRSIGVRYTTLAQTCKILLKQGVDAQSVAALLTHLHEYITTNPDFAIDMQTQADKLIKKLEKDPITGRAIALIRGDKEHRPTIRSFIYETFLPKIRRDLSADIEIAWHYRRRDTRPIEFNFEHAAIQDFIPSDWPVKGIYYMIYSRQATEPHFGDDVSLLLMAYKPNGLSKEWLAELMQLRDQFPPDESEHLQWAPWVCLWAGSCYRLADLGKRDADGLTAAYAEAHSRTAPKLIRWLRSRSKKPKCAKP